MIDEELDNELAAAVIQAGGVTTLSQEEAKECLQRIAASFIVDSERRWWWESIAGSSRSIKYDDAHGLSILEHLVGPESRVNLVVTDDADPPWPVYSGNMKCVLQVLRSCRFFEYILAAQDGSWIIFDTHMNELVIGGNLPSDKCQS
jgi:hypothetical protein